MLSRSTGNGKDINYDVRIILKLPKPRLSRFNMCGLRSVMVKAKANKMSKAGFVRLCKIKHTQKRNANIKQVPVLRHGHCFLRSLVLSLFAEGSQIQTYDFVRKPH